jgi:hypothetical protein
MTAPKVVRTMCPMIEVEGGRLKTVSGDKDNPDSQGFLCVRGRATNEIFGNPSRLLYPQIRDDDAVTPRNRKGEGNREHKLRPKPARQSPTLLIGRVEETSGAPSQAGAVQRVKDPPG